MDGEEFPSLVLIYTADCLQSKCASMAAPQIPNLNTLRNARGSGRGRGRGQGGPSGLSLEKDRGVTDRIVQQTDQDASVSRLSAVEVGYLDDPFAKYFVSGEGQRRFPIINRGM